MRWFQSPLLCFVEAVLLVSFSPCFSILKMTILPFCLISPLWERTFSSDSFREFFALLPDESFYPRQATPSICMIAIQWHGSNYLNLFKILFELLVICSWHFSEYGLILLLPWYFCRKVPDLHQLISFYPQLQMRWIQSPLLCFIEPVPLESFSPCFNILKMTFLPLHKNSPSERELFPTNLSAASPHFFPVISSTPGKPQPPFVW